ncbi:hypothetical protein TNCV_231601 [Trichonephila clavipes]|nr:hypothetical protein TNCV_231601 [Trichonephila clavipes]
MMQILADSKEVLRKDTFQRLKKCFAAGFELIKSNCQSLKKIVSFEWKRQVGQIGESLIIWGQRTLEDAGKNGWTTADFSIVVVAADLER